MLDSILFDSVSLEKSPGEVAKFATYRTRSGLNQQEAVQPEQRRVRREMAARKGNHGKTGPPVYKIKVCWPRDSRFLEYPRPLILIVALVFFLVCLLSREKDLTSLFVYMEEVILIFTGMFAGEQVTDDRRSNKLQRKEQNGK